MRNDLASKTVAFIGGGSIAKSLIAGITKSGLISPSRVFVTDHKQSTLLSLHDTLGIHASLSMNDWADRADIVVFCVKPKDIVTALAQAENVIHHDTLYISVVAGCQLEFLIHHIHTLTSSQRETTRFVRAMPNTSSAVMQSATAYALSKACSDDDEAIVKLIFDAVGLSFKVEESMLDAVTGLSGSGPAYVYYLVEAMTEAGVHMGLPTTLAEQLATQTLFGAASLLHQGDYKASQLRQQVTSPGGTTMAGLAALEEHGFKDAIKSAIEHATNRAKEMGLK